MELNEALKSDLHDLRQLYGLLQSIIGYGIPNISIENVRHTFLPEIFKILFVYFIFFTLH